MENTIKENVKRETSNVKPFTSHLAAFALLLLLALLPTACKKEVETTKFDFTATIEQPSSDSKVLLINEEWIFWEMGDRISVGSDVTDGSTSYDGTLINAGSGDFEDFVGAFVTYLPWDSKYFVGLHPYSSNNKIIGTPDNSTGFNVQIDFPATQPIRGDSTFGKQVMPMVAWYGGTWATEPYTPFNFDFHSLGAIVRLQLFNSTDTKNIDRIEITPKTGYKYQLSGMFNVLNYNTFDPHLVATAANPSDEQKKITITCDDLEMTNSTLWSFYLVLPAFKGMDDSSYLHLTMKVITNDSKECTRNFTVPTRRNGITYMNALNITNWETGTTSAGLVGNGTKKKPFKIYTAADMVYLRDCFKTPRGDGFYYINNQKATSATEIRIMRSDIVLDETNWNEGINNFVGHMTYYGSNSSNPGITNNSQYPIFTSIAAGGKVDGLAVKVGENNTIVSPALAGFSPFCFSNAGTIENCRFVSDNDTLTVTNSHIAGLCVQNTGTIRGCGCLGTLSLNLTNGTEYSAAGICLTNSGTIDGCYAASPIKVLNYPKAAGICYTNNGTITNSYFSAQVIESTASWGGIAYTNNGGTITNCYTGELANIYTTGTVGGIVNTLTSGTINHCRGEMNLRGSIVGGIASTQENGYIKNCFCDNTMMTITVTAGSGHYGGGMVGRMMKGWLENGFCNLGAVNRLDNQAKVGGIVGQIEGIGEGSGANTHIRNIYVYESLSSSRTFYGNTLNTMTFAQCYVIDGGTMQYGINAIADPLTAPPTSSDINSASGTIEQMRRLLNSFVETSGYPEGWWKWSRTNDAPGSYSGGTGLPFLTL